MRWIFENFGFFVFVFIAISMARAIRKAMQQKETHDATTDETEEQANLRRIREGIRRKIAERRSGGAPGEVPPVMTETAAPVPPPLVRTLVPAPTPQLEPFGGPAKREMAEFERRVQPKVFTPPPAPVVSEAAALARQEELAEQMRMLEESRMLARRRAAEIAAMQQAEKESESGALKTARGALLADLLDPKSVRRAFVLREVLGAPVALR